MKKLDESIGKDLITLYESKKYLELINKINILLKSIPKEPFLYNLLGMTNYQLNKIKQSMDNYYEAIKLNPKYGDVYNNIGVIFHDKGELDQALINFKKAVTLKEKSTQSIFNIARIYHEKGMIDESIKFYSQALTINPKFFEAQNNLGHALREKGKILDSIKCLINLVKTNPTYSNAYYNLGESLRLINKDEEAEKCFINAIKINEKYVQAYNSMANLLINKKSYDDAINYLSKAIKINPSIGHLISSYYYLLLLCCDWSKYNEMQTSLKNFIKLNHLKNNIDPLEPFPILGIFDNPEIHKKIAQNYTLNKFLKSNTKYFNKTKTKKSKKIKIAYLSADFHEHATSYLMAEMFEKHDKSKFEIHAISFGPDPENSKMRERLVNAFDEFHIVRNKSDLEIAKLINNLQIKISIDLKGYTKFSKPKILSYRPSPIQIQYLGYPGTMGAEFIDYIFADKVVIPKNEQKNYTEKIIYLPDCYQVNDTKRKISKTPSKISCGLNSKDFVFACFNNSYKLSPNIFKIWMNIMKKTKKSLLWLLNSNKWARNNIISEAKKMGIDEKRIIFAEKMPSEKHLARIKNADLFLDTYPYNGHTTSSDVLFAGVPFVTLIGKSFASRVGSSLLETLDLTELITNNYIEYENLIIDLVNNKKKLSKIKDKLNKNSKNKSLFKPDIFCKNFEFALEKINSRYEKKLNKTNINVI